MTPLMNTFSILIFVVFILGCKQAPENKYLDNTENQVYQLIWQDEFNYTGLPDNSKWSYDVGDTCDRPMGCGWGNKELQYYTNANLKNARIEDGNLIIEAHKEKVTESDFTSYTSARLVSKNKGDFKYGKIEVRAKVLSGKGTWSAIWMLPTVNTFGGWPKSGEIDIMEHVGYAPDTIYGTAHTEAFNHMIGTQKSGEKFLPDVTEEFHTYTLEWSETKMKWLIDDVVYHTFKKVNDDPSNWPFDKEFYVILNLAIGGNWGGKHGVDDASFPNQFIVDYVKVYELN